MANFKVSARTLDLLGRQQIASIPTAISELFKNAYDAYADNVEIDFMRHKELLVLRDNGYGMTLADFEKKWLTIGTDSKFGKQVRLNPFDKVERPVMGEKGVGRLAISTIGPQVLVVSRALRGDGLKNMVVAFVNWEIFSLPGLSLEDIQVELHELPDSKIPDRTYVIELVDNFRKHVDLLYSANKIGEDAYERLIGQLAQFDVDPNKLHDFFWNLKLNGNKPGTHFYICPVDESLSVSMDADYNTGDISSMQKMLIGFTNTMSEDSESQMLTAFRDYKTSDLNSFKDIISDTEFFTPEECKKADHHIKGHFDEYGQFKGTVTVYNEETFTDHEVIWSGANGHKALCGAFTIDFNYLQGQEHESKLNGDEYKYLANKCNVLGGLYIYRDGIRILPYGDTGYDFLKFEERRSKSASSAFFSYRRMYGAIEISHATNQKLIEKAGREGFIENKAYRQFKEILENFFIQLAGDFFTKKGGPKSELWTQRKAEFDTINKARIKRDKQAGEKKKKFEDQLKNFFDKKSQIADRTKLILETSKDNFESLKSIRSKDDLERRLLKTESEAVSQLDELEKEFTIKPPKGFALNKQLREDWQSYNDSLNENSVNIFIPAKKEILSLTNIYKDYYGVILDKRMRLKKAIDELSSSAESKVSQESKNTKSIAATVQERVLKLSNGIMVDLNKSLATIKSEFARMNLNEMDDSEQIDKRLEYEDRITSEVDKHTELLDNVRTQLDSLVLEKDKNGQLISLNDISNSLVEDLSTLQGQVEKDVELSQLGLAVGVIHHEFISTASTIKRNIKELKAFSDVDEKFSKTYTSLRYSFEHLDKYLALFAPLDRRMYRSKESIPYKEISVFILDLFKERFRRHNTTLKVTKGFNKRAIYGLRSTFFPIFVNIVDNAVYWLKTTDASTEKIIRFHADDNGFYISNNGPAITENNKDRIFEFGYSKKVTPSGRGRGMGLYVTRDVLKNSGYEINLVEPREKSNVTFAITRLEEEK